MIDCEAWTFGQGPDVRCLLEYGDQSHDLLFELFDVSHNTPSWRFRLGVDADLGSGLSEDLFSCHDLVTSQKFARALHIEYLTTHSGFSFQSLVAAGRRLQYSI